MSVVSRSSRRAVLTGLAGTIAGCASTPAVLPATGFAPRRIAPILMAPERIIRITVCTRPFRPTGPRLDVETVGETKVVHNYGHGGSG